MKVLRDAQHICLVLWDLLALVSPLSGHLDGRFHRFCTRIHREHHFEAEEFGGKFGEAREDVIVESSRTQCQSRSLFGQGFDEFGMAMALIDGSVGGKEIEIVFACTYASTPNHTL